MSKKPKKQEHYEVELTKDGLMEKVDTPLWQKIYKIPYYTLKYLLVERWTLTKRYKTAAEFMMDNKRLLVIVCDPQTDKMMMSYKGKYVSSRIVKDGKKGHVVRKMLKHSQFKNNIDGFIQALSENFMFWTKILSSSSK